MFSVFAALGDVTFSPRLSPSSFEGRQGASYAEHALVQKAPRLQYTGRTLDTISLGMDLHFSFCTPADERDKLLKLMRKHEALPLTFGNGMTWGYFVITNLSTTLEQCAPNGTPWLISLQTELKEYTGDPAKPPERPAVNGDSPVLSVFPGSTSLLSLVASATGGGMWDGMRKAVSYAQQARAVIGAAAAAVSQAKDIIAGGSPLDVAERVLGGAERLGGMFGTAAGLAGQCGQALSSCAGAAAEIAADVRGAVGAAGELTGLMRDGVELAGSLVLEKQLGGYLRTLNRVDSCLDAGQRLLDSAEPTLQRMTSWMAARKEVTSA